jgi:hypothetical protein
MIYAQQIKIPAIARASRFAEQVIQRIGNDKQDWTVLNSLPGSLRYGTALRFNSLLTFSSLHGKIAYNTLTLSYYQHLSQ